MDNQHPVQQFSATDDEIDLLELWNILWAEKFKIIAITTIFAVGSAIYSLMLTNIFRAEALLAPSGEENSSQFGGQLGFAANLAGVSLGQSNNKTVNALATLQSRQFSKKFITKHNLLPWLLASEFDSSEGRSVIDPELYDLETNSWIRGEMLVAPTDGEAFEQFKSILTVVEDQNTGLVTIAIEWPDPVLAAQWVNWLISDINGHIKEGDMQEARLAINYLQVQLGSTQLVEMQRVFYQLIESQTRTLMLADIREGYVFKTIDPAVVPEEKSKPKRALICILGTILGCVLAVLYVLIRYAAKNKQNTN